MCRRRCWDCRCCRCGCGGLGALLLQAAPARQASLCCRAHAVLPSQPLLPSATRPAPCRPAPQHLYLEHNELRELPGGAWWSRLHVLSLDWEPLLRFGYALLASVRAERLPGGPGFVARGECQMLPTSCCPLPGPLSSLASSQAPHLRKLAIGGQSIHMHGAENLPPLGSADAVLQALREHPALREVLLVARPTALTTGVSAAADQLVLACGFSARPAAAAAARPACHQRPLPHAPPAALGACAGGAAAHGLAAARPGGAAHRA